MWRKTRPSAGVRWTSGPRGVSALSAKAMLFPKHLAGQLENRKSPAGGAARWIMSIEGSGSASTMPASFAFVSRTLKTKVRYHAEAGGKLCVRRGRGEQGELQSCAARRIVGSPQAAAVRFNNGAADPQSHARAVSLGGKERIKDLVRLLRWKQIGRA